jgi:hypothetical protein
MRPSAVFGIRCTPTPNSVPWAYNRSELVVPHIGFETESEVWARDIGTPPHHHTYLAVLSAEDSIVLRESASNLVVVSADCRTVM